MAEVKRRDAYRPGIFSCLWMGTWSAALPKFLVTPLETSLRMARTSQEGSLLRNIQQMIQTRGLFSLWRGGIFNAIQYIPHQALSFTFRQKLSSADQGVASHFLVGAVSGLLTTAFLHPLLTAQSRLISSSAKESFEGTKRYNGLSGYFRTTYQREGWTGIYPQFGSAALGVVAYRSLYFGIYDSLKRKDGGFWGHATIGYLASLVAAVASLPVDNVRRALFLQAFNQPLTTPSFSEAAKSLMEREGAKSLLKGLDVLPVRALAGGAALAMFDHMFDKRSRKHAMN